MNYINDLKSKSSVKIRNAAKVISNKNLSGYGSYLIEALIKEIEKPKAWKTQSQLIKALALTNCTDALLLLKELINRNYDSTILYKELGFAIYILENIKEINLDFFYQSIKKDNELQICGVCSGILYKKTIPKREDIRKIISAISKYTDNEGQKITPRCYIAAVAYLWSKEETKDFLESCKQSTWNGLVEIAKSSLSSQESKIKLV